MFKYHVWIALVAFAVRANGQRKHYAIAYMHLYITNFDVDFISANDDLAENALKMANQARTDFSLSIYRKNKALQKFIKSKWISKAFSRSFFFHY